MSVMVEWGTSMFSVGVGYLDCTIGFEPLFICLGSGPYIYIYIWLSSLDIFTDHVALRWETRKRVKEKLELWKKAFKSIGNANFVELRKQVQWTRRRDRPIKGLNEIVGKDMMDCGVTEGYKWSRVENIAPKSWPHTDRWGKASMMMAMVNLYRGRWISFHGKRI